MFGAGLIIENMCAVTEEPGGSVAAVRVEPECGYGVCACVPRHAARLK